MRYCLFVLTLLVPVLPLHADLALVKDGASNYEIVLAPNAGQVADFAAKELQEFIAKASGATLPIVKQASAGKLHVFVGPNPVSTAAGVTAEGLRPEGFRIKTVGQDLHLVGADKDGDPDSINRGAAGHCGTMNAVYELLERFAGVMFCWHDDLGTVVPQKRDLVIPAGEITDAPAWFYRDLPYSPEGQTVGLYGRRLRLGHQMTIAHAHSWFSVLPVAKYGAEHPEYYAEIKGERVARHYSGYHGGQVCTSNPEVIEIFAQAAIDHFNQYPERDMFSISPNDGGGFCQCAACTALDSGDMVPNNPNQPVLTDRLLVFYNAIAERMVKVHPDKLLGAYIYSYYQAPPKRAKPHPNLFLVNATNSAHGQGRGWEAEHEWEKQWAALTSRFVKYDIYFGGASISLLSPVTTHLIEKIKAENSIGINGGYLYIGQAYEQLGAGHYLLAKLMWNPALDARAVEKQYYDALYGAAGPDVKRYYDLLESRLRETFLKEVEAREPGIRQLLESPDRRDTGLMMEAYWPVLEQATRLLEQARGRELSEVEKQRLARLEDHHQLLVSTLRGYIAAGRLETQAHFNEDDVAMLKAAVDLREAAKARIATHAPTVAAYLEKSDKEETARVSPHGAFYQLARGTKPLSFKAMRTDRPLEIDGKGSETVWQQAPEHYLLMAKSAVPTSLGATARLAHDDEHLYVLVEGREEDVSKLVKAATARDNAALFTDDSVEIFIQPPGSQGYYQIGLGAGGAIYDAAHPTGTAEASDLSWDARATHAVQIGSHGWAVEIALPFAAFGKTRVDGEWRANIFRTRRGNPSPAEYTAVSPTFGGYHNPARFAPISFTDRAETPAFTYGNFENVPRDDLVRRLRVNAEAVDRVELVTDRAYAGAQALKLTVPEGGLASVTLTAQVKENAAYRAVIAHYNSKVTLNTATRAQAPSTRVIFRDAAGQAVVESKQYSWDGARALDKPDQWRIMPHVFTTPPRTTQISLTLFFHHPGEYWLDEVRLEEM